MVYIIIAILVILISSAFVYFKPKETQTKNIFNAEYYRGLNYLLNNEEDKAFKIFTALMDVDSSTIETHLALGGLYRKRGEFDKAIKHIDKAVALDPKSPIILFAAMCAYRAKSNVIKEKEFIQELSPAAVLILREEALEKHYSEKNWFFTASTLSTRRASAISLYTK